MALIDSSIPLRAVQPVQTFDPVEQYGRMLSLKAMLNQGTLQEEQIANARLSRQEAERGIQQQTAMDELLSRTPNPTVTQVAGAGGAARAIQFAKTQQEMAEKALKMGKDQAELLASQAKRKAFILSTAKDQPSYLNAIALTEAEGLSDAEEAEMARRTPFTPEMAEFFQQQAMSQMDLAQRIELGIKKGTQAHNEAVRPFQIRKASADAVTAEQAAAGTQPITPYQQAQLDRQSIPNSQWEFFYASTDPSLPPQERAAQALKKATEYAHASRPQVNVSGGGFRSGSPEDAESIAEAIVAGRQSPVIKSMYGNTGRIKAILERNYKFDLATAEKDWGAIQRHLATLNGPQQERLRQAVNFTYDSLDQIENLYKEWTAKGLNTRFKAFNKGSLAAAKQLGGEAGSIAQNLEAQINDLTSELGTVYKGGNASTDESLRLAAENLKADWNEITFRRALEQIRKNLQIRRNSILTSQPVGVSPNSQYAAPTAAPPAGGGEQPKATHRFNPATGKIEAIK